MKRFSLLFAGFLLGMALPLAAQEMSEAAQPAEAQETSAWKFTGMLGINASQTAMVNWAAGGNNNFAGNAFANLVLTYSKGIVVWTNTLDTDYGQMYVANQTYPWKKMSDKLNFLSNLGFKFSEHWQAAAQFSYKSQFDKGYDYKVAGGKETKTRISGFAAPAYIDISAGINYKPNDKFGFYFSPLNGRSTVVREADLRSRYGVAADKMAKTTLGMSFTAAANVDLTPNVKLISALSMYTPYNKDFGNIDVDWDMGISYNFLKVFNITLNTALKYYDNVMFDNGHGGQGPRLQFKEVLGIGLGYKF